MVQNIINIGEREDRILNIVKAKFGLKNKSEAVAVITHTYEENFLEPELRPEYIKKLQKLEKEKGISFKNIAELRRIIGE
ncbi:MAG: DUF2683 family protein [Nanoarchaeota archaeon]